jgi:hypothetical protein
VAVRSCTPQNQRYVVARIDTQSGVSATASVSSARVLRATVAEISPLRQSVVLSSKPQSSNTLGFGRVSVARLRRSALPVGQPVTAVRLLTPSTDRLSERERERFNTGFEKLDLTHALVDRSWLPNQLMETLLGHGAVNTASTSEPRAAPAAAYRGTRVRRSTRRRANRPFDELVISFANPCQSSGNNRIRSATIGAREGQLVSCPRRM